jgi:hypothetical protein
MTDPLSEFLKAAAGRPFSWEAERNCISRLFDWVDAARGVDPGADLRGTACSERRARRIVIRAGGMAALVGECMARCGFTRTEAPARGDIAIVTGPEGETGAIFLSGERVARFGPTGVWIQPAACLPLVAAWRV